MLKVWLHFKNDLNIYFRILKISRSLREHTYDRLYRCTEPVLTLGPGVVMIYHMWKT